MMVSWDHCIAPRGKYVCILSTTVETSNPERELEPAFKLLGRIEQKFTQVSNVYEPMDNGSSDKVTIEAVDLLVLFLHSDLRFPFL